MNGWIGHGAIRAHPKLRINLYFVQIEQIIKEDKQYSKEQPLTAKMICQRIKDMRHQGKYTQIKEAVREIERVKREVFMPGIHRHG